MNVYGREIRANLRSLIFWCAGSILLILGGMGKYAGMSASGQSMNDILKTMPQSVQALFGIALVDLSSATGFFAVLCFYLSLLLGIHAAMLGAGILSKEERDRTSEFLYVKPRPRAAILTAKLLAALTNALILNVISAVMSLAVVNQLSHGEAVAGPVLQSMAGMGLIQIIFLTLGIVLAAVVNRPKASTALAAGILLFTYFLSIAIDINGNLNGLRFLTPFQYFDPKRLVSGESFAAGFVALSAGLTLLFTGGAYFFLGRRDLRV